jgi:hypothetical protein
MTVSIDAQTTEPQKRWERVLISIRIRLQENMQRKQSLRPSSAPGGAMKQNAKGNVALYVVFVFTTCALTYLFHAAAIAVMWGPAVAAIIVSLLRRRPLTEIGW